MAPVEFEVAVTVNGFSPKPLSGIATNASVGVAPLTLLWLCIAANASVGIAPYKPKHIAIIRQYRANPIFFILTLISNPQSKGNSFAPGKRIAE
jgi:hypothetical protein